MFDDPVFVQAIAGLIGAISTAILLAAGFYWGPAKRAKRAKRNDDDGSSDGTDR